jgi:hypothetical protein
MNLDKTVKWIDKTCNNQIIKKEEINFVKLSSMPADF